jgi:hypothetical protein
LGTVQKRDAKKGIAGSECITSGFEESRGNHRSADFPKWDADGKAGRSKEKAMFYELRYISMLSCRITGLVTDVYRTMASTDWAEPPWGKLNRLQKQYEHNTN